MATTKPYVLVFDTPWLLMTFRRHNEIQPTFGAIARLVSKHLTLGRCVKILPFSVAAKNEFLKITRLRLPDDKIQVVPPGIRIPSIDSCVQRNDETVRILFVGRNFDRKGGSQLLSAFEKLCLKYDNLTLVIKTKRRVDIPVSLKGKIELINTEISTEQLSQLYGSSDIYVSPTLWEPFGLTNVEAMSYGLPVVASRHYAIPEIVEDGQTGFLFQTGNVDDLVSKLVPLIEDEGLRKQMGSAGRSRAIENFSSEKACAKLYSVYEEAFTK
ncbi:MAG: glycosyltransferase family 4 protein [Nitrososphaerales archaeon]